LGKNSTACFDFLFVGHFGIVCCFGSVRVNKKPGLLSGGQKTKLALARALLSDADILLLDEPTNFLDVAGKRWVMDFLGRCPKTIILISHDITLLDHSIDKVLYVNAATSKIEEYTGDYTSFLEQKAERERVLARKILVEQKKIERMEDSLGRLSRRTSAKGVRQRVMVRRRIERMKVSLPTLPQEARGLGRIELPEPSRGGEIPIRAEKITKSFGNLTVFEDFSFYIVRGERIALIGPNGTGKSTLVKTLLKSFEPDSGEVLWDESLRVGYYSQEFETFDFEKTLFQTVQDTCSLDDSRIRRILGMFLFADQKIFQKVGSLSGGEKTRLSIALLLLQNNNLLVLDEPTTYLDVMSQRVILEALKNYKGAMIVVSHTEEFIEQLAPQRVILMPEQKIDYWHEGYLEKVSEV
jgi:ATPase subunit of ABC transporter with duplicated ATPase domains